ncbi:hypothetical protein BX661DRAFT_179737, partial [Kickxella alabastrina]|uniref:uncharacterized protein n=1 Tax=Kickxella alabastrina TaxID=61397 RepID=UPI00221F4C10
LTEVPSKPNITIDKLAPEAERLHKFVRIAAMNKDKKDINDLKEPDDISYLVWESTFVKCGVAFMTFVCLLSDRYTDYIIQNMDQGMSSGFAMFILSAMFVFVFLKDLTFIRPSRSGKTKEQKEKMYMERKREEQMLSAAS